MDSIETIIWKVYDITVRGKVYDLPTWPFNLFAGLSPANTAIIMIGR